MDLHDAVLKAITVDWEARTVEFQLSAVGPLPVSIVAAGLIELHMPRREPWGPSRSVLGVEVADEQGATRLVFHMQSGDDLVLEASEITMP